MTLPGTEPRGPPPAFASDPLKQVSAGGKDSEGLAAIATGSSKPGSMDIVEMDGSTSAPSSMSNHETNFMKSASPPGVSNFFSIVQEAYYVLQILIFVSFGFICILFTMTLPAARSHHTKEHTASREAKF